MDELNHPLDAAARRRKLDDLFADEPFLSTTMKARLLHDRLQQLQSAYKSPQGVGGQTNGASPAYDPAEYDEQAPEITDPYAGASAPEGPHGDVLGLAQAAQFLRGSSGWRPADPAVADRLVRFRTDVLMKWLAWAPEREIRGPSQ